MDPGDLGDRSPASCLEEALEAFRRAIELDPQSGDARAASALALLLADRPDEALAAARRAVAVAPCVSACWVALGRAQLALGSIAEARASADRALTPGFGVDAEALSLRDEIAAAAGDGASASEVPLGAILEISRRALLSPVDDGEGRLPEALADVDERLAAREDLALLRRQERCGLLMRRGRILLAYRRRLQTLADARARVRRAPADPRCCASVAAALHALGRHEESISAARHCLQLDPAATYGWMGLGLALDDLQRPAEALEAFDAARRLDPGCSHFWLHCAQMLVKLGREEEAAPMFHRSMELEGSPDEEPPGGW